ncbi:uncharacterized protein B0H18DRAFT_874117 [Fomitopsis serialis]|uniref:uncharacterized protein n=1 Tax=Fomitopsis serialis TaxID=139415 RepID=UPI002008514E|nr:uncharacterized protein B0H18DRAFT_874117 [Neoantrodia serialis]KAH9929249.1 hypothetical protein B0H18DRAFT_874117 [Neoantrodia serialis]
MFPTSDIPSSVYQLRKRRKAESTATEHSVVPPSPKRPKLTIGSSTAPQTQTSDNANALDEDRNKKPPAQSPAVAIVKIRSPPSSPAGSACSSDEDYDTDDDKILSKRASAAGKRRGPKLSVTQRRQRLESDEWALKVEPNRVLCRACRKWYKLHAKRAYVEANWTQHKRVCLQITGKQTRGGPAPPTVKIEVPPDGNAETLEAKWSAAEQRKLDDALRSHARWIVDFNARTIRSARCELRTSKASGICDACERVPTDPGFRKAMHRKDKEQHLPENERRAKDAAREKYTPSTLKRPEVRDVHRQMQDPLLFSLWTAMRENDPFRCYLQLYQYAREGKLIKHELFEEICKVLVDKARRESSDNKKLKHGIRYSVPYLQFSFLMRGRGQFSAQNYSILGEHIPLPNPRTIRYLVAKSDDCLQNPDLHFDNIVRVKRFLDSIKYSGPVAVSGDCTKVRPRVMYSTDFGGHVLGSTLPLDECTVHDAKDIDRVVKRIQDENAYAKQTRVMMIKVPLPEVPPLVIALLPTDGSDDAKQIHAYHCQILDMAARVNMRVVSFAADGAASELNAQVMMDTKASSLPPFSYEYPAYGVLLKAPVFSITGPVVSIQDPEHARKTARNQPQHGTHTASLGQGHLVYRTLVALNEVPGSGLVLSDVQNVDKQDDGAARRMFHAVALKATTYEVPGKTTEMHIKNEFIGLHAFCPWLLGTNLLEHFFGTARSLAPNFTYPELLKLVKHITLRQRCVLAHKDGKTTKERNARTGYILDYDNTPLTKAELLAARVQLTRHEVNALVELAASEASALCASILKMRVQSYPWTLASIHDTVKAKKRKATKSCDDEAEDENDGAMDSDVESDEELEDEDLEDFERTKIAAHEVGRLVALSEDLESTKEEFSASEPKVPEPETQEAGRPPILQSEFVSQKRDVSIASLLALRTRHQEGTEVRSQRVVKVDSKFEATAPPARTKTPSRGLSAKEASHRVRVLQQLHGGLPRTTSSRTMRWTEVLKGVSQRVPVTGTCTPINLDRCS